jgi:uncharacterized membrane protein (GlpM family)
MGYYVLKVMLSAVLIVLISEIAKRSSFIGGLLASLPVVSLLAFVWLYLDTRNVEKVADLSYSIFWLVLPSLTLFLALPWLLRKTGNFPLSLGLAVAVMLASYGLMLLALRHFDIEL